MDAKAVEVAHNERRRRSLMIQRGSRFEIRGERNIDQRIVEMLQSPSGPVVLPSYAVTEEDQCRGDDQGDQASLGEFSNMLNIRMVKQRTNPIRWMIM